MLPVAIFVLGYLAIVFEQPLGLNKSASALMAGVLCWTAYVAQADPSVVNDQLAHHLYGVSGILFFLLGAMTIVELIDAHDGFELITSRITTVNRRRLLATTAGVSFVLSAVLDTLTTSIVMMTVVRKLISDDRDRRHYAGVVIIAANAGGVWSPIGDVTTTMLWIGGQVTTWHLVSQLVLPALVSLVVPVLWIGSRLHGDVARSRPSLDARPDDAESGGGDADRPPVAYPAPRGGRDGEDARRAQPPRPDRRGGRRDRPRRHLHRVSRGERSAASGRHAPACRYRGSRRTGGLVARSGAGARGDRELGAQARAVRRDRGLAIRAGLTAATSSAGRSRVVSQPPSTRTSSRRVARTRASSPSSSPFTPTVAPR